MADSKVKEVLDTRKIMTGKDGQLFVNDANGNPLFLAEVDTFQAQVSFTNTDIQPVGSYLSYAVPVSYNVTLTMSEVQIRDDVMLAPVYQALKSGEVPYFTFSGKLTNRSGKENRQIFRDCIPDGSLDLMNIQPGDIIKRQWSFRVNQAPELASMIPTERA